MQKVKLKIGPWFFILILLIIPSGLYTILELSAMDDQEELYEGIYKNQLDAVLFSLNQYADDNVRAWVNDLEKLDWEVGPKKEIYKNWLTNNPQCAYIFSLKADNINGEIEYLTIDNPALEADIKSKFEKEQDNIGKIITYYNEGYRKIMGFDLDIEHYSMFLFISQLNGEKYLSSMIVDSRRFISDILSPRMQRIAGENFILTVKHISSGNMVFSTLLNTTPESITDEQSIWLLPDYSIGIQPKGATIKDVAKKRAYNNILFLLLIDVFLLIGAWFFYRNIKREINLAKIKSDFVSNVSHEIRTPLSLISMYAETLKMNRITEEDKKGKYYNIIYREAQRLSGIVNNILNFSRIESGKRQFTFDLIDINDVLNDVMTNYSYRLESKGFTAKVELCDDLPMIKGDSEAINEAITNLLDNAIKYSKEIKQIEIYTKKVKDSIHIGIKDFGIGIPTKEQKHIFDKFYRVTKGALALHAKGSGLGLSIVNHVMQVHKGKVTVESEESVGSTFTLVFPIQK